MAARRRSKRKANWPDNLYETGGYFSWRNPVDGTHFGLGRIALAEAFQQAKEANLHVSGAAPAPTLVDRLTGAKGRTVGAWADEYHKLLAKRTRADNTRKQDKSRLKAIREAMGAEVMEHVSTLRINEVLRLWTDVGENRMAQSMRSFLLDFFNEAIAEGWITSRMNPVDITRKIVPEVKRERLTWETFQAIYAKALTMRQPWIARSMELALVSAQRREDVSVAQFARRDDATVYVHEGWLWIDQGKTGEKLRLPLSLRLEVLGLSLDEVVRRCRDAVVSRWVLHHSEKTGGAALGDPVWIDTVTKGFRRARDLTDLKWEGDAPTFHELRSLAERLYGEQGNVDTQVLLGHRDPRSTRLYHDSRGAEWTDLKVG